MPNKKWTLEEVNNLRDNWQHYLDNKETAMTMFGCDWSSLAHKAYRNGIRIKSFFRQNPRILNEAENYIDGLLLSDGTLHCNRMRTGIYQQSCKHREWLEAIKTKFLEWDIYGLVDNGRIRQNCFREPFKTHMIYSFYTLSYVDFKTLQGRWYTLNEEKYDNKGKLHQYWNKIVPKDISLSPECVANWYMGDGCISTNPHIILCTQGFKRDDVIFLSELLSDTLDIKCNINKRNSILISGLTKVKIFIDYIREYKIECYDYKFPSNEKLMYDRNKCNEQRKDKYRNKRMEVI